MLKPLAALIFLLLLSSEVDAAEEPIQLVSNGWHTGFLIPRADIPPALLPEMADFDASAQWFEIGWGSAVYYPTRHPGWKETLQAALPGGGAVLHIAAFDRPLEEVFPGVKHRALCLTADQRKGLVTRILGALERNGKGRVASSGPGLYPFSAFYPAKGSFHLLHTCNSWSSEMLQLPITSPIAWGVEKQLPESCPAAP